MFNIPTTGAPGDDATLMEIAAAEVAKAADARAHYEAGCLTEITRVLDLADDYGPEYFAGWEDHRRASDARAAVAHAEGRAELALELADAQRTYLLREAAALTSTLSTHPTYADLALRRGEQDRADRQRQLLAERGIA